MDSQSNPETASSFFDRLVLISNSIPKSGSTFLYSMQQTFLHALSGKKTPNFARFTSAGVLVEGGYVGKPHSREFLQLISDKSLTGGPYVFKTHTLLNADLRAAILGSDNVFASLAIRDPLEVFFSARDNFRKTGEFPEFASTDRGCETINNYFTKIFESSINTSRQKTVPLIHYDQIVSDPMGALLASLHPLIKDNVMRKIAEGALNLEAAGAGARGRLNVGGLDRIARDRSEPDFQLVSQTLADTRRALGYGR